MSSPIIKQSLSDISVFQFLFIRFVIATILFSPIFLSNYQKPAKPLSLKLILLLSILGTPLTLIPLFLGLQLTTSLEASFISAMNPIFIIIGGVILLREIISKREEVGLAITLFGTLFLAFEPLILHANTVSVSFLGNSLILLSNFFWAIFVLLSKRVKADPLTVSMFSFFISIPFFFVLTLLYTPTQSLIIPPLSSFAFYGILYMAICGSIIGFWTRSAGQESIQASEAAIITYLQPLFALPLSYFWLHEPVSPALIISLAIVALGVFISETRKKTSPVI